jgi:hypothetical protein
MSLGGPGTRVAQLLRHQHDVPVVCQNSAHHYGCAPIVVLEDTSQPFLAADGESLVGLAPSFFDQLVVQT